MVSLGRKPILYFEDPIGVTPGYQRLFDALSRQRAQEVSLYRIYKKEDILVYRGNRKSPGYNDSLENIQRLRSQWERLVTQFHSSVTVITDPALLFLCVLDSHADWGWATIDNLRGGVYGVTHSTLGLIKTVVTYPLTAWHTEIRDRDIAAANYGFADEDSFRQRTTDSARGIGTPEADSSAIPEESDENADESAEVDEHKAESGVFYHPIQTKVAVGKFCLHSD